MRAKEYQGRGAPADDARRAAVRRFGSVALMQDRGYDIRGGGVMETVLQDVRYGVRLLGRQPGFSLMAILTLALGIGVTTTLFSVIDAVVLRRLPYPNPGEMVSIEIETTEDGHRDTGTPSLNDVRRWRDFEQVFSQLGIGQFRGPIARNVVEAREPERVTIGEASEGFLEVYGVTPRLGRPIQASDVLAGAPAIVLLGHEYWISRFAADPDVVGRTIRIDGEPASIVGVLPAGFCRDISLWRPFAAANRPDLRGPGAVHGRLRGGVTLDQAAHLLTGVLQAGAPARQASSARVLVQPLDGGPTARQMSVINVLAAAVGLVLLIACVNVAGLVLARGSMRQPELALRASLGAGRRRLVRQLLTESLVLSMAGASIGMLFAWLSLDALVALVPFSLPANSPAELNLTVLGATATLALLLPLVFGLVPAIRLSRVRLGRTAAQSGRRFGPAFSRRGGQVLTALEVGLAVVLLAGAGLMVRSFERLISVDLGFEPENFLTMEVAPVDPSRAARAAFYPPLLDAIRRLPGVASAGAVDVVPLGGAVLQVSVAKRGLPIQHLLPGYFESLGLRAVDGRFPNEDDRLAERAVAVLSESAARRLFPDGGAVGQSFEVLKVPHVVIGVVADVKRSALSRDGAVAYLPYGPGQRLSNMLPLTVVIRPEPGITAPALAGGLRHAARSVGPPVVIERIRSGTDWLREQLATRRHQMLLLGLLGAFALGLTLVGIFSVTAFAVARRTHEIGVRMAFGARPGHVVLRTVRDAAWPVAIGLAVGLAGALFGTRVLASFLFETTPTDPATFLTVTVLLGNSALLAAWIPARRAARVDPMVALRAE
jgi:predicted permease